MGKIIFSFVLLVLAMGSCFAVPAFIGFKAIPSVVVTVETGEETFTVDKASFHLLGISRPSAGLGTNQLLTVERRDVPEGHYAFVDRSDGSTIELSGEFNVNQEGFATDFYSVGSAELGPGTYGVLAPEMPENLNLEVRKTDLDRADFEDNAELLAGGALGGCALGGLLGLAGIVLLILGIVEVSRKKSPEA